MQGPVLKQFSYDEAHPYAAGQHRGIDIGAEDAGESVVAPAAGTVSFAGTVPTNGESVTIQTTDGYSITLTHLGTIHVAKGATVAERDSIGTVGPSGTPEADGPYVHLGVRHTADPNGYVDPSTLLPPLQSGAPDDGSTSTVSQPSTSTVPTVTQTTPAPAAAPSTPVAATGPSTFHRSRGHDSHEQDVRTQEPRTSSRSQRPAERPASQAARSNRHQEHRARRPLRRRSEPTRSSQRPVVETVAHQPTVLDAGQEFRPSAHLSATHTPDLLVPLVCNGAAALAALAAAFVAGRRRRRVVPDRGEDALVLHLPRPASIRRAA